MTGPEPGEWSQTRRTGARGSGDGTLSRAARAPRPERDAEWALRSLGSGSCGTRKHHVDGTRDERGVGGIILHERQVRVG